MLITVNGGINLNVAPYKLKPAFKAAWLKSLRDPNTKQVSGVLKGILDFDEDRVGFCCLGVGACVLQREFGDELYEHGFTIEERRYSLTISLPNEELSASLHWELVPLMFDLGEGGSEEIRSRSTEVRDTTLSALISLNDTHRWSLLQIADFIEEHL